VALRRNNPVINNRAERFTTAKNVDRFAVAKNIDRFAVAKNKVRRKLHLSLANPGFLTAACQSLGRFLTPQFGMINYTLNEWPGRARSLPLRPAPVPATPLCDAVSLDKGLPSISHPL
jgi:hypothetical protein